MQSILILCVSCLVIQSLAYTPEEGNVTATFGPYWYQTNFKGLSGHATSPILGGVGLIANGDISDRGALEIAMFYMNKEYFRDQGVDFLAEQTQLIHITMGYRRWLSPYLSTSLAFFSAYGIGEPRVVDSDIAPGHEIDTSARDVTEYGMELSLQSEIWTQDKMAVVLDARYSYSLTAKSSEHSDHYGLFVGFRYFIQKKQVTEKPKTSI